MSKRFDKNINMATKRGKKKTEKKPKSYLIKMPVYTTTPIEEQEGFFGALTYDALIGFLESKLKEFKRIETPNRNQTSITVINKIEPIRVDVGKRPGLLLKISYYKTNVYDGYFEGNEKRTEFDKNSKIGSDSNYALFYPQIKGTKDVTYSFLIVAYEDPGKLSNEVAKLGKTIANKVFNQPIQNIKVDAIMKEVKSMGNVPELEIKYYSFENSDNDIDARYRTYLQKSQVNKEEVRLFKDMPTNTMEELINDPNDDACYHYQKKVWRIKYGKTEYRIKRRWLKEAEAELQEVGEKIFNADTAITQEELNDKIFDQSFMIEKMSAVITNYLGSYE